MTKTSAYLARVTVGSAISLFLAAPAFAASGEEAAAADDESGDIVVSGSPIRDSLANSLDLQKRAPNIVNAITSDDAGQFPDQIVAAALARPPGIGVHHGTVSG